MDIKTLDPHKGIFRFLLELLPIESMIYDIENNADPLISNSYKKLKKSLEFIKDKREKKIFKRLGISAIYSLMDPVYGDPMRYIFSQIKDTDPLAKTPKDWRINQEVNNGET